MIRLPVIHQAPIVTPVWFRLVRLRITEVVKNEKREKGVEVYRVVMVKYDWNQTDLWKKYAAARGKKNDAKRKGIVLLRWNAFDGKWQVEGWDVANEKDEIETTHVTDVLGRR